MATLKDIEKHVTTSNKYYMPLFFDMANELFEFECSRAMVLLKLLVEWFDGKDSSSEQITDSSEIAFLARSMAKLERLKTSHIRRKAGSTGGKVTAQKRQSYAADRRGSIDISQNRLEDYAEPI